MIDRFADVQTLTCRHGSLSNSMQTINRIARNVVDKADQSFTSISYTEIIILQLIWVCSLAQMKPVKYGETTYPQWSIALGWMVALLSIIPLPIFMIRQLRKAKGDNLRQVCTLVWPNRRCGVTPYGQWFIALGWVVALQPVIPVPILMIGQLRKPRGITYVRFVHLLGQTDVVGSHPTSSVL